ncbi:response regulator receiver protein [filamentous cyanobacterium CCP5]|nr:response regulator receiver protein [filamentous cyanobacterium CCP5]
MHNLGDPAITLSNPIAAGLGSAARAKKILIVDDSPDNLRVLASALSNCSYDIRCAKSGLMALKALEAERPNLILLDVRMPDLDGYEVCQRLKSNPVTRDIPVIFLSALDAAADKVKAFEMGGADYITKPFQIEEVMVRVRNQLELQSARSRLDLLNSELEQRVQHRTLQLQSANHQLRTSEERLEGILNALQDIVWSAAIHPFQILYLNPAAATIYQRPFQDFLVYSDLWFDIIHPSDRDEVLESIQAIHTRGEIDIEYRIVCPDGEIRWLRNRSRLMITDHTVAVRIEGIISDISDRKRAEQRLVHDALHDALTQLPNRTLFIERIESALRRKQRHPDYTFAVLFIDLDRFKIVNDSLGHGTGDRLLVEVANRLLQCIRASDTVARLGGDEFTILLDDIASTTDVINCVKAIQTELKHPITINGNTVFTGSSIGIVVATAAYTNACDLLRDADIAMYRAKETRQSGYELFDQAMYAQTMRRLQLENELRISLERSEFEVYYQPIYALRDRGTGGDKSDHRLLGFEALLRWHHPQEGLINPTEFIPIAEETGLIVSMGRWVLEQACRQIRQWQERYRAYGNLKVSVNITSHQIWDSTLLDTLDHVLETVQLSGQHLRLELTESTLMQQTDVAIATLKRIRQREIQISIDDFGTGYSSLSYLSRFPIDNLKIDQSFVGCMHADSDSFEIVRTIIALAHALGMDVTAEGVELPDHIHLLQPLQCEYGQGFFFSPPLRAAEAEHLLATP